MFDKFKNLFGNKAPEPQITDDEYQQFADLKEHELERVLGKMYDLVGHAIIPFQLGGAVDMYYFPNILEGTGFATMCCFFVKTIRSKEPSSQDLQELPTVAPTVITSPLSTPWPWPTRPPHGEPLSTLPPSLTPIFKP